VHELGAELDGERRALIAKRVDSAPDAIARLEDDRGCPGFAEASCGGQSCYAGAYDDDFDLLGNRESGIRV
jgi:hypothetical protein